VGEGPLAGRVIVAVALAGLWSASLPRRLVAAPPLAPPAPVRQRLPVEVQIFVLAAPSGKDQIAVSYWRQPTRQAVEQDFGALSEQLGIAPVGPTISVQTLGEEAKTILSAEATVRGLTDRRGGQLNLAALLQTFSRFHRLSVTWLFAAPFRLEAPRGAGQLGALRYETQAQPNSQQAQMVTYQVWPNQGELGQGSAPPVAGTTRAGKRTSTWLLLLGGGLAAALAAALMLRWRVRRTERQRTAAAARQALEAGMRDHG